LGRCLVQINQSLGLWKGERPQEKSIENAENGGVSCNPQREHPDHHQAEARLGANVPHCDLEIVEQSGEKPAPVSGPNGRVGEWARG
jgi:hypothetical protein